MGNCCSSSTSYPHSSTPPPSSSTSPSPSPQPQSTPPLPSPPTPFFPPPSPYYPYQTPPFSSAHPPTYEVGSCSQPSYPPGFHNHPDYDYGNYHPCSSVVQSFLGYPSNIDISRTYGVPTSSEEESGGESGEENEDGPFRDRQYNTEERYPGDRVPLKPRKLTLKVDNLTSQKYLNFIENFRSAIFATDHVALQLSEHTRTKAVGVPLTLPEKHLSKLNKEDRLFIIKLKYNGITVKLVIEVGSIYLLGFVTPQKIFYFFEDYQPKELGLHSLKNRHIADQTKDLKYAGSYGVLASKGEKRNTDLSKHALGRVVENLARYPDQEHIGGELLTAIQMFPEAARYANVAKKIGAEMSKNRDFHPLVEWAGDQRTPGLFTNWKKFSREMQYAEKESTDGEFETPIKIGDTEITSKSHGEDNMIEFGILSYDKEFDDKPNKKWNDPRGKKGKQPK